MGAIRQLLAQHRRLAAGVLALALLVRLLIPTGYMIGSSDGTVSIMLCTGAGPVTARPAMAMPGMAHHGDGSEPRQADPPCVFAGLSAPALAGADPIQLAVAIAFVLATVFRTVAAPILRRRAYLQPPLRGPPAFS